ncbi:MAG TPA: sulfotransferase domain-containing protein [Phenylobacterium sp.]|jgi:aryl sulfotransferase
MPELVLAPSRRVLSRVYDSARWAGWKPRDDDIVIATYAKVGTTWMQRIVSLLVFAAPAPVDLRGASVWPDARFGPIEPEWAAAEAMTHRRFFKAHLPYDALPIYAGVKLIHVARDGRDAALSLHNHLANFTPQMLAQFDERLLNDPKFSAPFPRFAADDPATFFHLWLTDGDTDGDGDTGASFFHLENSFWAVREQPDVLMVHYADLKKDLLGEMRRIAAYLAIEIPQALWPSLLQAASIDSMRREAATTGGMDFVFQGGADRFFNKGVNGRWQGMFTPEDLALYDAKIRASFTPDQAFWLEHGRLGGTA